MYRVAMELNTEECNEKVNLCSQSKLPDSPVESDKFEQSRSDLTEDEEMLTAESEDEQIENGSTDLRAGGDNKLIKTTIIDDNDLESIVTVNHALDITNTGEGDRKSGRDCSGAIDSRNIDEEKPVRKPTIFGLDGHCVDSPVIAVTLEEGQGALGMLGVCIPQIIVEGPEEDNEPIHQFGGVSVDSLVKLNDGENWPKNASNVHLEDSGSIKQHKADELLKHSAHLIDDPTFDKLNKIKSQPRGRTEDTEPDKNEIEAAAPLQAEESEIPPDSKETGEPNEEQNVTPEGKEPKINGVEVEEVLLIDEQDDDTLIGEDLKELAIIEYPEGEEAIGSQQVTDPDDDCMEIELECHGGFLEDNGKVKTPQIIMIRSPDSQLEQIPEMDEFEESGLECVEIVKCESETAGPEPEEKPADSEETQQPDEVAEGESTVESSQEPESDEKLEGEKTVVAKDEGTESGQAEEREVADGGEKGTEEAKSSEVEQTEVLEATDPDTVREATEEATEVDLLDKPVGFPSGGAEKFKGKDKGKGVSGEDQGKQDGEKRRGEDDSYLRPRGRSFPFKLKVMGVPMGMTREEIMEYFSQYGDVLKAWRENKRRIQVVMADEEGYKKALSLRKPRIGDAEIWIQSVTEAMAVVTGIPTNMDADDVAETLMTMIESIGVCVCRVLIPRTEPKTEENPNPPLQGHAFVYFPDTHSLEKVRGTLRLELGDTELGMFASRNIFEERFCVHVSPLCGELPRSVLDKMVREALSPAGDIATVNLVQAKPSEGLSANVIFSTQDAAQKATALEGLEICGKPVTVVPFVPGEHGQRDRQLWVRVNNMPKDVTEEEVKKHFAVAGEPKEIMMEDNQGMCMMIMESEVAVQKCLTLHQTYMRSDRIVVLLSDLFGGQSRNSSRRRGGEGHGDGASTSASFDLAHGSGQGQQPPRANRGGGGFTRSAFRGGQSRGGGGGYDRERGRGAFGRGSAPRFSRSRGFARNRDRSPEGDAGAAAAGGK